MDAPLELQVKLAHPAVEAGVEPADSVYAHLKLAWKPEAAVRPRLDLCFLVDASASMHTFKLDPAGRLAWQQKAEQRGEVSRQQADGRTGMVWRGQTLRELQREVSTPMLSTLRGIWRCLEALQPDDGVSVLAFADRADQVYADSGVQDRDQRLVRAREALARLGGGVDESGLGRGTHLREALALALDPGRYGSHPGLRRLVLVSDGIIEDRDELRPLLDRAVDAGVVISVIGVGDEFDEELLMMVADLTRGNYYYAATALEAERAVRGELEVITSVVGRSGVLKLVPENGALLRDVYPVAPQLSEFQSIWVENGGWRLRLGDFSASQEVAVLVELAAPALPEGEAPVARARVEGLAPDSSERFAVETPISLFASNDPLLLQARDDGVLDLVRKLEIYRLERRAAEAARSGDAASATRHLRAATRALRKIGREDLASEMEAAAEHSEAGTRDLAQEKRVKLGTRRLNQPAAGDEPASAPVPAP